MDNIDIHDPFQSQEQEDVQKRQQVKQSKDMLAVQLSGIHLTAGMWVLALGHYLETKMLRQVGANISLFELKDPCSNILCAGNLKCPAGFTTTTVPGHRCAYCMNSK